MATAYQSFHHWLFNRQGIGVSGEQVALMAPVPSRSAYPDAAAQEYAAISLDVLSRYFREPRLRGRNDDALVSASLRLLILEPIFAERGLARPSGMLEMVARVKATPSVVARVPLRP